MRENNPDTKNVCSYQGRRPDIIRHVAKAVHVLDVGCNTGAVARQLKEKFPESKVWGIDINSESLQKAAPFLEEGFCLNLDDYECLSQTISNLQFDTIIAGDVLEHTINPWKIVQILCSTLVSNGTIYVSLPNIAHWQLLLHVLKQSWPLRERGIYDNTHLRNFMRRDLEKLAPTESDFILLERNYRFFKKGGRLDCLTKIIKHIPWFREYFVFQYIFAIQKR